MAKEISGFIKLQIKGGQANPAPPVGPALGQRGVNIMEFCKAFNDKTKSMAGSPYGQQDHRTGGKQSHRGRKIHRRCADLREGKIGRTNGR